MFPAALSERLETLIDELILDGGIEAASLASILLAAKDSIRRADHMTLSRRVWTANEELLAEFAKQVSAGLELSPSPSQGAGYRQGAQTASSTPAVVRSE